MGPFVFLVFETIAISNLSLTVVSEHVNNQVFETIAISNLSLTQLLTYDFSRCLRLLLFLT